MKAPTDDLFKLTERQQQFQKHEAFYGVELVPDVQRLALMNVMLHDIEGDLLLGDTLSQAGRAAPEGRRHPDEPAVRHEEGRRAADARRLHVPDLATSSSPSCSTSTGGSKPGGRAAVVLPDNVLFEENVGATDPRRPDGQVRPAHDPAAADGHLLRAGREDERAVLHARREGQGEHEGGLVLRHADERAVVRQAHAVHARALREFEKAFGDDPLGKSKRKDEGEEGRFRKFTREEIAKRGDNLDISWLKDEGHTNAEDLPEPEEIAAEIIGNLQMAMAEMEALQAALGGVDAEPSA